jgi:hypothetical protein
MMDTEKEFERLLRDRALLVEEVRSDRTTAMATRKGYHR